MLFDTALSPAAIRALDAVDEATRIVRDSGTRLGDLAAHARHLNSDADWRAPSSQDFHERLERWLSRIHTAQGRTEEVADALSRVRVEVHARAWAGLL